MSMALRWPRWLGRQTLGVPLVAKIIGANVIIVAAAIGVQVLGFQPGDRAEILVIVVALAIASVVNVFLVRLALRPVADLEELAKKVSGGEFAVRGTPSPFADAELARLGETINGLLDSLAAERKRIQALGVEVIYAQDAERARASRELHDSIAQTLAAVNFQLSAAGAVAEGDMKNRLAAISGMVKSSMEEIRNVSYSLHPRVAEDLGLEAALDALAQQVGERSGMAVSVRADIAGPPIPRSVSTTLFRVAQEALRNVELQAHAKTACVDVKSGEGSIRLEVSDDGFGFDPASVRGASVRSGLASIQDRVALSGGVMQILSVSNGGTRVIAEFKTKGTP